MGEIMSKLQVAVIGTGYLGKFHAEKYCKNEDVDLVAVVDINPEAAEMVAKACDGCKAITDYNEIIDKVDAVSIVTPTETHHRVAKDFLSRGKHVLLEKPMTVSVEEAQDLIEVSEANNAMLQIGHLERFNAAVTALNGRPVNPLFIESHRMSVFTERATDVDVVLDLMIHDIDIILNIVKSHVEDVRAVGVPVVTGMVDIANARLTFANGAVANVTASRVSKEPIRRMRMFQPDAYIAIDYAHQKIEIARQEIVEGSAFPKIIEETIDIERKDALKEEIKSFVDCIKNNKQPLVGGYEGKRALEVAHIIKDAIEESMTTFKSNFDF